MQTEPGISVVMTTYNGERYLPAQLESIGRQTCPPDELVVGDDQSSDNTAVLVAEFAQRHPHIAVRFERNATRLGSSANFEAAIRRSRHALVVFADQDDVWFPHRIACLQSALDANPGASYAFSNGSLIDGDGRPMDGTLFDSIDFHRAERQVFRAGGGWRVLLRRNVVTGAALAVRRTALMAALPVDSGWIHDYFLALRLQAVATGVLIDEPLIQYRRHAAQQVGVASHSLQAALAYARKQSARQCRSEADAWGALARRLQDGLTGPAGAQLQDVLTKQAFFQVRARMREQPWLAPALMLRAVLRGDYHRLSLGMKQLLVDMLAVADVAARARRH
jgi:glycosyltransferase involved in cell wall biosynthesis